MELYNIKQYDDFVWIQTNPNAAPQSGGVKQNKALIRYAARCARKANLCTGCYTADSGWMGVTIYSRKDLRRLEHFYDMLYSKRAEKVFLSSLGR